MDLAEVTKIKNRAALLAQITERMMNTSNNQVEGDVVV